MLKLIFTYKGRQWQIEGEDQQIISFIASFPEGTAEINHSQPVSMGEKPRYKVKSSHTETPQSMIDEPLRSMGEVVQYLLNKPAFSHDLFEVQEHFYGRKFTSRGTEARMYNRTIHQLREARKMIERAKGGTFKETRGEIRGQKRYVFESGQPIEKEELVFKQ